ncbi:hypothetical protein [Kosakonia sp.]|uniref:fimbrial adhesin EcpD n=1 Tax=Kosakonia sp. TaxID=1916651 RepID=UPI0028A026C6|nr:hypothetical protein [Kosakonia sp.]
MRVKRYPTHLFLILIAVTYPAFSAVTKTVFSDAPTREYVFVENDTDDSFFVTPAGALDPRMTGSNRWTTLKGSLYQQSLGYIDNGYNTLLNSNWRFDMWLENSPVAHPLSGLRCISHYSGCDANTSLIEPEMTDNQGFYGVVVPPGGAKWMHGMMSDQFYQQLNSIPVGSNFSMTINGCQTRESYNASQGERCQNMATGLWYTRKVSFTKGAQLKLYNTSALSEIFINSDGKPTLGADSSGCFLQVIGRNSGVACRMMSYVLNQNGLSNTSIQIFPSIKNAALEAAISSGDMQFSLDGQSWKTVNGMINYYTFNDMKGWYSVFVFLSSNFLKKMVDLGISDVNSRDIFNFRLRNITAPESGWYEFSTSSQLIIKPRDFSISIISSDAVANPTRQGNVGNGNPSLDFDYTVTTNGKTAADEVMINVSGPTQSLQGRSWCIFSSPDGLTQVPFPAYLSFATRTGDMRTYDVGCDGQWRDMTDAFWVESPWIDSNGNNGLMNKSTVRFSVAMDSPQSLYSLTGDQWYGDVSAAGEIRVKATWRNVP